MLHIFNTIFNDAPQPWEIGLQDSVAPGLTVIVELDNAIFFYLIVIFVGVFWVLSSIIYYYNSKKSPIKHKYLNQVTLKYNFNSFGLTQKRCVHTKSNPESTNLDPSINELVDKTAQTSLGDKDISLTTEQLFKLLSGLDEIKKHSQQMTPSEMISEYDSALSESFPELKNLSIKESAKLITDNQDFINTYNLIQKIKQDITPGIDLKQEIILANFKNKLNNNGLQSIVKEFESERLDKLPIAPTNNPLKEVSEVKAGNIIQFNEGSITIDFAQAHPFVFNLYKTIQEDPSILLTYTEGISIIYMYTKVCQAHHKFAFEPLDPKKFSPEQLAIETKLRNQQLKYFNSVAAVLVTGCLYGINSAVVKYVKNKHQPLNTEDLSKSILPFFITAPLLEKFKTLKGQNKIFFILGLLLFSFLIFITFYSQIIWLKEYLFIHLMPLRTFLFLFGMLFISIPIILNLINLIIIIHLTKNKLNFDLKILPLPVFVKAHLKDLVIISKSNNLNHFLKLYLKSTLILSIMLILYIIMFIYFYVFL